MGMDCASCTHSREGSVADDGWLHCKAALEGDVIRYMPVDRQQEVPMRVDDYEGYQAWLHVRPWHSCAAWADRSAASVVITATALTTARKEHS